MDITSLPVDLAVRLTLDAVSYSNPLPPWSDVLTINYDRRGAVIRERIQAYAVGARQPGAGAVVAVPNRKGVKKPWVVPSTNDQIVLQTCVCALSARLSRLAEDQHVYSYRYNTDVNRLQLTKNQIDGWAEFQEETNRRLEMYSHVLQIDIENAFGNIDSTQLIAFLQREAPDVDTVPLLGTLISSFQRNGTGLPLVNDALFFIGNAYFAVVDRLVAKHTAEYIRFVDDYRIFGTSREQLEKVFSSISQDVASLGFRLNDRKAKLGTAHEYLDALMNRKRAETVESSRDYISATALGDVLEPHFLVELVARTILEPDLYLNEGMGRLLMGAVRRMRMDAQFVEAKNYPSSPHETFSQLLSDNNKAVAAGVNLLQAYLNSDDDEDWRAVWLLYVLYDVGDFSKNELLKRNFDDVVKAYQRLDGRLPLAKLWSSFLWSSEKPNRPTIDQLHDLDYVEAGRRMVG